MLEPRVGKNRMHLELWVDDLGAAGDRVRGLGGSVVEDFSQGSPDEPEMSFLVCADPEGNVFCIATPPS